MNQVSVVATCLVRALQYLGAERNDEEYTDEDDLKILEEAATLLGEATDAEIAELRSAAERLGYSDWMRDMGLDR